MVNQSEELLESIGETTEYIKQYTQDQIRYIKLEVAERTAKVISELATSIALVFVGMVVILLLSLTLGLWLGNLFQSYVVGFGIVSSLYLVIGVLIMLFKRKMITNPIIALVVQKMLD